MADLEEDYSSDGDDDYVPSGEYHVLTFKVIFQ